MRQGVTFVVVSAFFQECGLLNRKSLIEDAVKLAFDGELPRDVGRRRELLGKRSEKELEEIMEKLEQVSVKYIEIGYDAFYDDVVRFLKLRWNAANLICNALLEPERNKLTDSACGWGITRLLVSS